MSERRRCNSCLGEYDTISADGVPYAHACPPITMVRVKRGLDWQAVPLAALKGTDTIEVQRGPLTVETTVATMLEGDVRLGDSQVRRPAGEHRDENVRPGAAPLDANNRPLPRPPKAEGKGYTTIA